MKHIVNIITTKIIRVNHHKNTKLTQIVLDIKVRI